MTKKQNLVIIGDIHGKWNQLINLIENKYIENSTLIQVGDFGVGFIDKQSELKRLQEFNKKLKNFNNVLYVIRGNHDNPAYFNGNYEFSNLKLLKDYSTIEINGLKIALIGGAISIDRMQRILEMKNFSFYNPNYEIYWPDERFILDKNLANTIKNCTYIITHTAPDFCWPNNKFGFSPLVEHFAKNDKNLKKDLTKERNDMTKLYNILREKNNIKKWFYGHFHASKLTVHEGIEFHLLNINELKMI